MTDYICIGVPYFIGERIDGRTEVDAIKASGFHEELGAPWIEIEPGFSGSPTRLVAVNRAIEAVIQAYADRVPLIFASCCTSALGALKGLEAQSPSVLWYDAHGDFNTPDTTPSGFLGGMPLAWLVGDGDQSVMNGINLQPIAQHRITITDARDLDPGEKIRLENSQLRWLRSVDDVMAMPTIEQPLYVHMDTDVVDINDMPGMNYPAANGPSLAQTVETLAHLRQNASIAGVLFSLWNDTLPTERKSLTGTLEMARAITGLN